MESVYRKRNDTNTGHNSNCEAIIYLKKGRGEMFLTNVQLSGVCLWIK